MSTPTEAETDSEVGVPGQFQRHGIIGLKVSTALSSCLAPFASLPPRRAPAPSQRGRAVVGLKRFVSLSKIDDASRATYTVWFVL